MEQCFNSMNAQKNFVIILALIVQGTCLNAVADEWGNATNGVQALLVLRDDKSRIGTNDSIVVSLKVKNTLTNETFCFYFWGSPEASFSYSIISPSGIPVPRNESFVPVGFGTGPRWIASNQTTEYEINLSKLYKFNEIGTYKIIGKIKMESKSTMLAHGEQTFDESKAFEVISNPLSVTTVAIK